MVCKGCLSFVRGSTIACVCLGSTEGDTGPCHPVTIVTPRGMVEGGKVTSTV